MIAFATPWVLAGLGAAAIPIVLHLFARRDPPTVMFPAVRYLDQAAQRHQRRMSLQHWLLLLVRTLLIVVVVLAAAGPRTRWSVGASLGTHTPTMVVVIVDNSPSTGVVRDGIPLWSEIRQAAAEVLRRSTPEDELVLLAADGVPRRGDAPALVTVLDSLAPSDSRLDLGGALGLGQEILRGSTLPGELVLLTDLQRSAAGGQVLEVPLLVGRPDRPPPPNVGIAGFDLSAQPWSGDGGLASVRLMTDPEDRVPLTLQLGQGPRRQVLSTGAITTSVRLGGSPGWSLLRADLPPDEFRADDTHIEAIRILPPPRVAWPHNDQYLATAMGVLLESGRILQGPGGTDAAVTLDGFGRGVSIVFPPEDPARLGALNRALASRGAVWRYGPGEGSGGGTALDSSSVVPDRALVHRRLPLVRPSDDQGGVLVTAGQSPWMVQDEGLILIGSRLTPAWTDLPLRASFIPFLDRLLTQIARGTLATLHAHPGEPVFLPDRTTAVLSDSSVRPVEGGARYTPTAVGPVYLVEGSDTIGVLNVSLDPRESDLDRLSDSEAERLWPGARLTDLASTASTAYMTLAQTDLQGPFLWLAALLALLEIGLASGVRRRQ